MKPRIFIGTSVERLDLGHAIQKNLEHDAEVTVWNQGVFQPSSYPLESLIDELDRTDFGLFVFAGDDITNIRGKDNLTIRDNVIFELGLFVGRLGRRRVFFLVPRGDENLSIPTDLWGITPLSYDPNRSDGNLVAAIGSACSDARQEIRKLGKVTSLENISIIRKGLIILYAYWGLEEGWNDVADILTAKTKRGDRRIQITRDEFGDPAPYRSKVLKVSYAYQGQISNKTVPENEYLVLPED